MNFSKVAAPCLLLTMLGACGSGGPGTVSTGPDSRGPFAPSGSKGPFGTTGSPGPFAAGDNPGPFAGSGDPGSLAGGGTSCAALCAPAAGITCTSATPGQGDQAGGGAGSRGTSADPYALCVQQCQALVDGSPAACNGALSALFACARAGTFTCKGDDLKV